MSLVLEDGRVTRIYLVRNPGKRVFTGKAGLELIDARTHVQE